MARVFNVDEIKARDIMTTDVVTAEAQEPLSELLGRMKKEDVYELPVLDKGHVIGMVSYDVLLKRRQFPLTSEARSLMVSPPTIGEDEDIARIAEVLLSSDMRAVLVTHKAKLIGLISRGDLLRHLRTIKEIGSVPVMNIMTPSPTVIQESDNIERARQVMKSLDQRSVPVVDDLGKLVGVIGAKDIVSIAEGKTEKRNSKNLGGRVNMNINVGSVMISPAVSIEPDALLKQALDAMVDKEVSTIIVTKNEMPQGVISQSDVLEYVTSLKEREGLYVNITGLDDHDPDTYDALYSIIEKAMKRVASIVMPQMLTMHISKHNKEGDVAKHSIRVRLSTVKGLYNASTYDWDLFSATDDAMRKLEKQIHKDTERNKEKPRGMHHLRS
jgi:CBS domain-containing protein/ribosome-associated translation inhibitor RaiA